MIKLGLLGKDIAHTKSPEIYKLLLEEPFEYSLFDYEKKDEIPSALDLLQNQDGISITAPYKTHYLPEVEDLSGLGIINTLRKSKNGRVQGTNTDILAIEYLLARYLACGIKNIRILGDGSMSKITQKVLNDRGISFKLYSRREGNLDKVLDENTVVDFSTLLINTCARDFVFKDDSVSGYHFWDMNYDMPEHHDLFRHLDVGYLDGLEQLYLQAKYALSFWNLNKA